MTTQQFNNIASRFRLWHKTFIQCAKDGTLREEFFSDLSKCRETGLGCSSRNCPKIKEIEDDESDLCN